MKNNLKQTFFTAIALVAIFLSSCSKDKPITPEDEIRPIKGVYILNEGDFRTSGTSTLSYLDFSTDKLTKNIFSANNPNLTLGAGLADMDIYGDLLFITETVSDRIRILKASTAKVVKEIEVAQPRYIAFYKGKAFITTYKNKVVVIDTLTNAVTNEIPVGATPEHIVTLGDKLYVANSDAHNGVSTGVYESTVSVINPITLKEERKIEVPDNVYRLFVDGKGNFYGNTVDIFNSDWSAVLHPSRLFRINTNTSAVDKTFDFGVSQMDFYQDKAFFISANKVGETSTNLYAMSLEALEPVKLDMIDPKELNFPQFPYALSINPENGDLWYANSDFTNDGKVFHYKNGTKGTKEYTVGLNPSVIVFN